MPWWAVATSDPHWFSARWVIWRRANGSDVIWRGTVEYRRWHAIFPLACCAKFSDFPHCSSVLRRSCIQIEQSPIPGKIWLTGTIRWATMLYFAYGALLDPDLLDKVAPAAKFLFIAHLPETRLSFPTVEGFPSVEPATGHTVWGGVFEVTDKDSEAIAAAEAEEGRGRRSDLRAVDRAGNKYDVVTFHHADSGDDHAPSSSYMQRVVKGARHWSLPTGWVAGLEDLGEDALI
jgi:hypothetical protein